MNEKRKEGVAETLRGALVIVIAGALLGLGFNALALKSHPRRGLTWITREEKMPSLEELQTSPPATPDTGARGPASSLAPPRCPRIANASFASASGSGGSLLVLAATLPPRVEIAVTAPGDSGHAKAAAHKRAAKKSVTKKAGAAKSAPARSAAATPKGTTASKPATPAKEAPVPPSATKISLPTVPDLDKPIEVKLENVKKFFDAGPAAAAIVDARGPSEYAEGHVQGAVNVPYDDVVAKPELLAPYKKLGKVIITYCSGGDCEESKDLAKAMIDAGIRKVLVFTDGYPAWKAAGYPIETGAVAR
jgi:rhodanese-related sulfurtransferase